MMNDSMEQDKTKKVLKKKSPTKQVTFVVNEQLRELIEQLKEEFNVDSTSAVLRKALALSSAAVKYKSDDHTVTFRGPNDEERSIIINA